MAVRDEFSFKVNNPTNMSNNTATRLIHSIPVDPLTGAISVPIYQTSTFVQEAPGVHKGWDYARTANPTRRALEDLVAGLEGGASASAFASGLAAIDAVVKLLRSGDEILAVDDIYGGAFRQFTHIWEKFGISVRYVDTTDAANVLDALTPSTKLIWLETPTNPTLKISDIEAIARLAKAHGALLCVDNTFLSPALQQPLHLGADLVVHSATKYLGGHSDLIAGIVVAKEQTLGEQIRFIQNACGAVLAPHDSWLVIRGIETLPLRIEKHCTNALAVAQALRAHPAVDRVYYPGLETHPNHAVALKQQQGFGGIVSFTLQQDTEGAARAFATSTSLFKLAESLGGVKSLLCHPATMTHKSIPAEQRRAAGVSDSLIRLSVGLEDAADLIADLEAALFKASVTKSSEKLSGPALLHASAI
jgi:cystathionine beta-lyase